MKSVHQLENASCSTPFSHLGAQWESTGAVFNAWLPGATSVTLIDLKTGKERGELSQGEHPHWFSLTLKRIKKRFTYAFNITTPETTYRCIDPYQFQAEAFHAVHYIDHAPENLYRQAGAQLYTAETESKLSVQGVRFAVYAPNASAVSLIGDFNLWNGSSHPMQRTDLGFWVLFVPNLGAGTQYKYQIKDAQGNTLPHKADPLGFSAEQHPSHASRVYDHSQYDWQDSDWMNRSSVNPYTQPMSIYEVHLGSWKRPSDPAERYLSYRDLANELIPYLVDMRYTHVELMPVSEYPFDGSWGYQPVGLFAPTSRFGHPDDFKYFVDQCHQHGVGVIIDWVPAHFPEDGHGLARFDGTCVYEYEDPRKGWHPDWNSCIYDFGKQTVRQFLVANALYWLDKFHIDGLRVDAVASMLYLDYSRNDGEWIPNVDGGNHNYEAISLLQWMNQAVYKQFPNAMTIAEESTSYPKVSRPVYDGGLGFGFKWNMGWMHDSLHFISKDPAYRRYHHGDITFSMVYAFNENFVLPISHDEVVHGKGSMLHKMPGDEWQQAANLRCYAAFMYAHPGKKLNFMGVELAQPREWDHDGQLQWDLLQYDKHKGVQSLYRELNTLYRTLPALHEGDTTQAGFAWLDHENAEQSVLSFVRYSADRKQKVYVITNFTPLPRDQFKLGVEDSGHYTVLLNTDAGAFWGSDYAGSTHLEATNEAWNHRDHCVVISLPPLATLFIAFNG
ncbi:1,4-alpha-glucan branching protein GlgB [Alteromonas oceanisediminis]|uniref:1,4-alpha-glucan branching protein GlgB n=1 Tax=Alteromonas oceanisediminis TaxID=2836180 RepID=UPI001BDA98CB|nr:1,4-alpha-glucan branching protein GlgB [Alteromonas oceanisediminis]MBT0586554.1 1,4-alpha-glucan branching protein GlgB [Alteromonas oceanisediminis]